MDQKEKRSLILSSLQFRHACKIFDTGKSIPAEDMEVILEAGRLSPSSFGMQGVRYLILTDPEVRTKLKAACWNQNQIDTSSHLVVFLTRTSDLEPYSDWVKSRFDERDLPRDRIEGYYDRYANFHKDRSGSLQEWAARQCYIPLGNMLTAAAMLGIDSCPLEGFEREGVEKILGIDSSKEMVVVMAAFGYRVNPAPAKLRLEQSQIMKWI